MSWTKNGTVNVTNGSAVVVGVGTTWVSLASAGDGFIGPNGLVYEVASVNSDLQITLSSVYLGGTLTGQAYTLLPTQDYLHALALQAAGLVADYATVKDAVGAGKFGDGTQAVPGIRFSSDDDSGMRRIGANNLALVAGGADQATFDTTGVSLLNVPKAPTAAAATNTTQVATTAHVFAERTNTATLTNKTLVAPALGTPVSGVLTNATGLPVSTGITGLGAGVATFLATPSSANLAAALTNESGTGSIVMSDSAALTGNPTAPTAALGDTDTSIATTAFVQREKEYLAALSQSLHIGAVVKAIVYATDKDSDGGAWRKRCQDKSWYTETLGGDRWIGQQATIAAAWTAAGSTSGAVFQASATAGPLTIGKYYAATSATTATEVFRGITRDFPAVAGIVAEANRVVVYDLSTGAMWRVFYRTALTTTFDGAFWNTSGTTIQPSATGLAAANGSIFISTSGGTNWNYSGLLRVNFAADDLRKYSPYGVANATAGTRYGLSVASTPGTNLPNQDTATLLVSGQVNDVAITVLDNAPIDPNSGLPTPTICCATAGGVSVIKQDGTVVNSASASSVSGVLFDSIKTLRIVPGGTSSNIFYVPSPLWSSAGFSQSSYGTASAPAVFSGSTYQQALAGAQSYAFGKTLGLTLLKENPTTPAKGMAVYVTNAYNSGWQIGDSRGAYLADTVAETITASGELVTNGAFTTDTSGWSSTSATLSVSAGTLLVTGTGAWPKADYPLTGLVAGRTYCLKFDIVTAGTAGVSFNSGADNLSIQSGTGYYYPYAIGSYTVYFRALFVAFTLTMVVDSPSNATGRFDNISVKLAEPDRSVKNKGLVVNGTLTKTAVASGAGLVRYSGFSSSNYLEQPYNSDLDFGTGDFCVMGWVNLTILPLNANIISRGTPSSNQFGIYFDASSQIAYSCSATGAGFTSSKAVTTGLHFIGLTRSSGILNVILDGAIVYSVANTENITNTSGVLRIGVNPATAFALTNGSLALWRISATAPSADQIAHIYRTELPLFQPNAQCTIAGTSTAVAALAYDDSTDLLHVGTSWGRSGFKDLLRVDSEATTTGAITSLSASQGVLLTGGTSAKVYVPAMYLRDELQRKAEARQALGRIPVFFDFDAVTSQVAFVLPKGYTTKAVYSAGLLKRVGSTKDYTTGSDGFAETVTFAVAPGNTVQVSIMAVRSI